LLLFRERNLLLTYKTYIHNLFRYRLNGKRKIILQTILYLIFLSLTALATEDKTFLSTQHNHKHKHIYHIKSRSRPHQSLRHFHIFVFYLLLVSFISLFLFIVSYTLRKEHSVTFLCSFHQSSHILRILSARSCHSALLLSS